MKHQLLWISNLSFDHLILKKSDQLDPKIYFLFISSLVHTEDLHAKLSQMLLICIKRHRTCTELLTFHISHVRISQKLTGFSMSSLQHIIFILRQRCWQIFKSALAYLKKKLSNTRVDWFKASLLFLIIILKKVSNTSLSKTLEKICS